MCVPDNNRVAAIIPTESNASARAVNRLLVEGAQVSRSREPIAVGGVSFARGAFILEDFGALSGMISNGDAGLLHDVGGVPDVGRHVMGKPRVGVYRSYVAAVEEGWTRYVLDEYGFDYVSLLDGDVREGGLAERFDAIVLPNQPVRHIHRGHRESYYHPKYSGGLGEEGAEQLREFVEQGERL